MAESANEPNQPKDEDRLEFLTAEESAWEAPPPSEPGDADPEQEVLDADFRRHRTPFESIVRGHLFVHAALIQYVEAALERQGALDLARMDFYLVVRLAVALGLIDPDDVGGLGQINALRNRFAHNIRAEISLQDGIDLYNALGRIFGDELACPHLNLSVTSIYLSLFIGRSRCCTIASSRIENTYLRLNGKPRM